MKKLFIGALLASAAFTAPVIAADTKVMTTAEFCASQRLSADAEATCLADLAAATTDAEKARVMDAYERRASSTSPPLRNDLKANDAGVKRAEQSTEPRRVESTGVTVAPSGSSSTTVVTPSRSSSSTTVTVEPRAGASATTGSAVIVEEPAPSTTPLRNDLRSNEAGVKNADQPTKPALPN
ncbi:MAG: hypothetical protein AB7E79_08790 [Rhodospirillaceae bacterium]